MEKENLNSEYDIVVFGLNCKVVINEKFNHGWVVRNGGDNRIARFPFDAQIRKMETSAKWNWSLGFPASNNSTFGMVYNGSCWSVNDAVKEVEAKAEEVMKDLIYWLDRANGKDK